MNAPCLGGDDADAQACLAQRPFHDVDGAAFLLEVGDDDGVDFLRTRPAQEFREFLAQGLLHRVVGQISDGPPKPSSLDCTESDVACEAPVIGSEGLHGLVKGDELGPEDRVVNRIELEDMQGCAEGRRAVREQVQVG
jgi:hypothetical protein